MLKVDRKVQYSAIKQALVEVVNKMFKTSDSED